MTFEFCLVIRWVKNEDGGWWNDRKKTGTRSYAACVFTTAFDSVCFCICFTTPSLCVLCLAEQSTSQAVDGVVWDPAVYHNSFRHVSHFHGDICLQRVPQVFNVCTTRCLADWPSLQLDNYIFHVIWWIWMKFCLFQSLSLSLKYRISITFCKSACESQEHLLAAKEREREEAEARERMMAVKYKEPELGHRLEVRVGMLQWSDDLGTQFYRSTWADCVEFFSRLDIEQWSDLKRCINCMNVFFLLPGFFGHMTYYSLIWSPPFISWSGQELDIFKLDIIARELKALDNELGRVGGGVKSLHQDAGRLRRFGIGRTENFWFRKVIREGNRENQVG